MRLSAGGTAVRGQDYTLSDDPAIVIPAGSSASTATITFTPLDDAFIETSSSVIFSGELVGDPEFEVRPAPAFSIEDSNDLPNVILSVDKARVVENEGEQTITVTATVQGNTLFAEARTLVLSAAKGDLAEDVVDYAFQGFPGTQLLFELVIPARGRSGSAKFTLMPRDDNQHERNDTVVVSGSGRGVMETSFQVVDDDALPLDVHLAVSPSTVSEDDGQVTITMTAGVLGPTRFSTAHTVEVGLLEIVNVEDLLPAMARSDYETVASSWTLVIPVGADSASETFTLTLLDDEVSEPDEGFRLVVTSSGLPVDNSIRLDSRTVTIVDDDAPSSSLKFTLNPTIVPASSTRTSISATFEREGPILSRHGFQVDYEGGGTATRYTNIATIDQADFRIPFVRITLDKLGFEPRERMYSLPVTLVIEPLSTPYALVDKTIVFVANFLPEDNPERSYATVTLASPPPTAVAGPDQTVAGGSACGLRAPAVISPTISASNTSKTPSSPMRGRRPAARRSP